MGKVIIDGVNVSECDRLRTYRDWTYSSDKWCGISNDGGCECKQNPDCYYKQLQRAKAENERLKANKGRCAFKCLDNTFCPEADKKITELELSRDSYKVSYETAKKYREKAEQALQEIREITRKWLNNDWSCFHCRSNMDDKLQDIIDKINEVIGAEE